MKAFHRFWRANVVYTEDIFEAAAAVINKLGLYKYSSLHIRRNELQYKNSYITSATTLHNIEVYLRPGEVLYLATDETKDLHFFDALRAKHPIKMFSDFYDEAKGELAGVKIRKKVINCIEQVICSGGRRFFGTLRSTFSSYIYRLRGYMDAPDTRQLHHNIQYTGYPKIDNTSQPLVTPTIYMFEDPEMWEMV